jgi:Tfp pilus assembly PilM family ATPase
MAKTENTIGIDIDNSSIRAVKLTAKGKSSKEGYVLLAMEEIPGDFIKDQDLTDGLKKIKEKMSVGKSDRVVTVLAGKQTYVSQINFKRLPEAEMENALRFEIRKSVPFEVAGSKIDYQYLKPDAKKAQQEPLIVTAVSHSLLARHLSCLQKAGLKPAVVDLLPLSLVNALWESGVNDAFETEAQVILHFGPEFATLVIDNENRNFYHRTIYFDAEEVLGGKRDDTMSGIERRRRITGLTDEISRTLAFYASSFNSAFFTSISLMGNYINEEIVETIAMQSKVKTKVVDLIEKIDGKRKTVPGKFNVAAVLAMR